MPTNNINDVDIIDPIIDINRITFRPFLSENDPSGPRTNIATNNNSSSSN